MTMWYGGDYDPEQWPEAVLEQDLRLMKEGGINLVTVGVFSWALIEPSEGQFDFTWLDRVLDALHEGGISVDLATATASPPPWLTHAYPAVLPLTADGVRMGTGSRQHYCPSSPTYRRLAARLVSAMADRYRDHPAVKLWHVNNEYGCHVSHCYCDVSAQAFRRWLQEKYGTLAHLNSAWGTAFWSQIYSNWDEIDPPRSAPTFRNPAQLLDFDRFSSGELLECYRLEREILRSFSPQIPITTNFLGFSKNVDYWAWAPDVDFVSYDSYPDPLDEESPARAAMSHDLMRSLRRGQSWLLMEQAPGAVSWNPQNKAKLPGQMRAWSYQAIAHGSDGALFFQWRQSPAGAEKFLTGMVPHSGTDGRVWREVAQLGGELASLDRVVGMRVESRVSIMFDWDSWWSIEQEAVPAALSYVDGLFAWYGELYARNVAVSFVTPSADLTDVGLLIVPSLFVASAETCNNLDGFVQRGGTLLVTYQSAITDEDARLSVPGYLGLLAHVLGVRIEEFAPLQPGNTVSLQGLLGRMSGTLWTEYTHVVDAEVVASFEDGHLAGWPALTRRGVGSGSAWYLATMPDHESRGAVIEHLLGEAGIPVNPVGVPAGVEAVLRGDVLFVINHTEAKVSLTLAGSDLLTGEDCESLVLDVNGVAAVDQRKDFM